MISIISNNNIKYDNINENNIKDIINNICKFNKCDISDKQEIIKYIISQTNIIDNAKEFIQTEELITHFNKKIINDKIEYVSEKYYLFYPIYSDSTIDKLKLERNLIGEQLINQKEIIYDIIAIIKVKLQDKKEEIIDITYEDIYKLIMQNYIHNSIIITDNKIYERKFNNNPTYNFKKFSESVHENINFLGFTLKLYFSVKEKHKQLSNKNKINKYGTIIKKYSDSNELFPIYGPVLVTLQKEDEYIYLTEDLFNKIMIVISNISKENINNNMDLFDIIVKNNLQNICLNIPEDIINRPSLNSLLILKN